MKTSPPEADLDLDSPSDQTVSESVSETEQPTRPRGRPRNDGAPVGSGLIIRVPRPRSRIFKSDSDAKGLTSKSGFNWWKNLPEVMQERIEWYAYRDHPIMLEPPLDEATNLPKYQKNIDKGSGAPFTDDLDLLNRYGCGNYHIMINEVQDKVKKSENRTLCTIFSVGVGGGDYKSNPPCDQRITDIEQVDLNHPSNKAYIAYLRSRGLLPDQTDSQRKEDEAMANAAITEISGSLKDMTAQVIDLAKQKGNAPASPGVEGMKGGMDILVDGAKRSNEMLQETTKTMLEMIRSMNESGKDKSTEMLGPVMQLLQTVIAANMDASRAGTPAAPSDEIRELRAELSRMQSDRIAALERQIEKQASQSHPAATTGNPFAYLKEGIISLKDVKGILDDIGGSGATEEVAKAGPWWMAPLTQVMNQGLGAFIAFKQAEAAQGGRPMPQQGPFPVPQPAPQPPVVHQQPVGLPAPQPVAQPAGLNLQLIAYGNAAPLINYLQDSTGTLFARWFISGNDADTLKEVIARKDELFQHLATVPGFTEKISGMSQLVLQKFMEELQSFDFEAYEKEDESEPAADPVPV